MMTKNKARRTHLQHALFQNKMLPPELLDVLLDGAARWPKVVKARHAPIDLEGWNVKEPPLQCIRLSQ
jgi:hypothetical protein